MWYKYWSQCIFLNWCFHFLPICIPRSETAGSWSNFSFWFLKTLHTVLHTVCTILHSHQQCLKVPYSLHTPQHVISDLFDDRMWSVILHCSLDLHFSSDLECWASFHVPVDHLYIFFERMSIYIFALWEMRFILFANKLYEFFCNLIFILYSRIVDLQYGINFSYTTKWFSYTYS